MLERPQRPPPKPPPPPARPAGKADRRRADRWRRYRARQRAGQGVALAPFDASVVDFLIAMHWLDPELAGDRAEIGKAMFAALNDAARRA